MCGWWACAPSLTLITALGSRSALFKGSPLSQIQSLSILTTPPPAPLWQARATISPGIWQLDTPHCPFQLYHWLQTVGTSNKPKTHTFIWRSGSINRGDSASVDQTHSTQRDLQHWDTAMAPAVTSAMTISKEHLPLHNKVNSEATKMKNSIIILLYKWSAMFWSSSLTIFSFCIYSWESQWWRRCAETVSTAALSSSGLSWLQSSSTSSPTPSWRKQTSWRWPSASWDHSRSSSLYSPPVQQLLVKASPDVFMRFYTSCPKTRWRHSLRENCWTTSRTCSHQQTGNGGKVIYLCWAPQTNRPSAKRRVRFRAPSGGPGRCLQNEKNSRTKDPELQKSILDYMRFLERSFIFSVERLFLLWGNLVLLNAPVNLHPLGGLHVNHMIYWKLSTAEEFRWSFYEGEWGHCLRWYQSFIMEHGWQWSSVDLLSDWNTETVLCWAGNSVWKIDFLY